MALVLNEEQHMLRDAARDFLAQRAPVSHLRHIRDSGNEIGFSRELWQEMVEMGWTAILVPEEHGGLGYGYTGLGLVLEETGRTLTPSPLLATALTGTSALVLAERGHDVDMYEAVRSCFLRWRPARFSYRWPATRRAVIRAALGQREPRSMTVATAWMDAKSRYSTGLRPTPLS